MNANIIKTHISYKMKYDLQGHQRSHKVILKFQRGSLAHCPSPPLPSPSLTLSIFSLSLILLLHFSFSTPPPSTSASYPPYASLSILSPSFFFSLFLTLTYVLMDNFLSLFLFSLGVICFLGIGLKTDIGLNVADSILDMMYYGVCYIDNVSQDNYR